MLSRLYINTPCRSFNITRRLLHYNPRTPLRIPKAVAFTKIMCTVGPASESETVLKDLITKGARIFRLNFSHGDFSSHDVRLKAIRKASSDLGIPVAVCGDLQGPKIRVGKVPASVGVASRSGGGSIDLKDGDEVVLSSKAEESFIRKNKAGKDEAVLSLTYKELVHEVEVGHRVLINDGIIRMEAIGADKDAGELRCKVVVGGLVTSGKGINLPESNISAPAITPKDWECVDWAVSHNLDYVALSFVRDAEEVKALKAKLRLLEAQKIGKAHLSPSDGVRTIGVISKIEKPQAIKHINAIVEASDAIMVARGDLGVEMEVETVPVTQKLIIERCHMYGKPCIVATQMLETMIDNPIPTRAEASDVANAIFDGTDAVMLSAESATGKHPGLVVETMNKIIMNAEKRILETGRVNAPPIRVGVGHKLTAVIAYGAWHLVSKDNAVKYVVCWSQNGNAARYLSQNDFNVPIIAFSEKPRSVNLMALFNGVTPVLSKVPGYGKFGDFVDAADAWLVENDLVKEGDTILVLGGKPLGASRSTNTMQLHVIGSSNEREDK